MVRKAYNIFGLGPGNDGKGAVVHKVAQITKAHTIIKVGGAQGSHGVWTAAGENFAFSQWGCGTFEGVKTHISTRMIVSPEGLLNEADSLRYQHGVHDAFNLLTIDQGALCATPYHGIASRLKEMARGNNPRSTIGTGVGEAYRDLQRLPELAIRVGDFSRPDIKDKLAAVREQQFRDLAAIMQGEFLPDDREEVRKEIDLLYNDDFLSYNAEKFLEVSKRAKIVDSDYLRREILSQDGSVVVENSHGILTDHYYGFYPYVSAIRTLPRFTRWMLENAGYDGQIVNIAVSRSYQIGNGPRPMPTEDSTMLSNLLPGSHKVENRYEGIIRVGSLDFNLLRYAIEVCGGATALDGLAMTWFDQIQKNGKWYVCDRYLNADDPTFFTPSGAIKVRRGFDKQQLEYQEALGRQLQRCTPEITSYDIPSVATRNEMFSLCADVLGEKLGVPVRMVSFGPTELDKVCK